MELEITTFFVLSDELNKAMNIHEDSQVKMTNPEVMTVILTAARFLGGHIENARKYLEENGYILNMLSESRLNRRIHAIDDSVWQNLFGVLAETSKQRNTLKEYIHDDASHFYWLDKQKAQNFSYKIESSGFVSTAANRVCN